VRVDTVCVVSNRVLVPLPVRRYFRDLAAQSTHREIGNMWQDEGFLPSGDPNNEQGVRRGLWREYEDNVDWTDSGHVGRVLRVYETLLASLPDAVAHARQFLDRYAFDVGTDGRVIPRPGSAARLPDSLTALRDPSMILDSFDRISRALPADPAQAIGSAKELVEATAKTVLSELGVSFDDKNAKLPWLVDRAQRELHMHPQTLAPGPDGSNAVKRILGGLSGIAIGLGELRNEGYGTGHAPVAPGHAPVAPRVGLHQRHANLAVGAAHTWCQLILDTLGDPDAPWRTNASAGDTVAQAT
jgi:hypothetical protein